MNDATSIQLFHNDQFGDVRALSIDGEPWFVATDVAKALGYRMASDMTRVLFDDEKGTQIVRTLGGEQELSAITEPGFYHAVMQRRSSCVKDETARANVETFQRWVTHDVLPAIRRHGAYATPDTLDRMIADPEFGIRLLTALRDEQERSARLERENATKSERIATLCEDNARLRPLAEYADTTLDAVGCITITDAARQLKQQDPSIGQRRLFGLLRADGLLCQHTNQATAVAIERGYLRNVQKTYLGSDGNQHLREPYAVVTPKGLKWMVRRYCRQTSLT